MGGWFEEETFWKKFKGVLFSQDRMKETPYHVDRIVEMLDLEEGDKIFDQCCAIGRLSLEFARRGYEVTGIDLTDPYLEEARNKAEEQGLDVEFIKADMREFKREETFDAALNFFTSFGYFKDDEENKKALENVYLSLKSGGKFLLDVMGKEVIDKVYTDTDKWRMDDGYFVEEREIREDLEMLVSNWKLVKDDGEVYEHEFMYKLYSREKIEAILRDVGFRNIEIYGDLEGSPYDEDSSRLIAIAEK